MEIAQDLLDMFIEEHNIAGFFETSSLTGQNVQASFVALVEQVLKKSTGNTPETAV